MTFRIKGLSPDHFAPLFEASTEELAAAGAVRVTADASPGYPCRVSLRDAAVGEELLLVNFEHQPAPTPYRSRHAVYVARTARESFDRIDEVPEQLRIRLLSVRAFDRAGMMVDADLVEGKNLEQVIETMLGKSEVDYLHLHFAKRGCYAARVERA